MTGEQKDLLLKWALDGLTDIKTIIKDSSVTEGEVERFIKEVNSSKDWFITSVTFNGFSYILKNRFKSEVDKFLNSRECYAYQDFKLPVTSEDLGDLTLNMINNNKRYFLSASVVNNKFSRQKKIVDEAIKRGLVKEGKHNKMSNIYLLTPEGEQFDPENNNQNKAMIETRTMVEKNVAKSIKNEIFIGHGHSDDWRELFVELTGSIGLSCFSFETIKKPGRHVGDILNEIKDRAAVAIIIMTADDVSIDGLTRARQNVVHEIGFFQGSLGFEKTIVLAEKDITHFTNNDGFQRIDYQKGQIKSTTGDLFKTLRDLGVIK